MQLFKGFIVRIKQILLLPRTVFRNFVAAVATYKTMRDWLR